MNENLLRKTWDHLDPRELRFILREHIHGPGQYSDYEKNPNTLYLPEAGQSCRLVLTFRDKRIVWINPGPSFDAREWQQIVDEVEGPITTAPARVGREYSFSSYRVPRFWRGDHSGVQILPPPSDAPRAKCEDAEHPFILEFPVRPASFWPLTNYRRIRDHRKLTLLLNVLLIGHTCLQPRRAEHFWATDPTVHPIESRWCHRFFSGRLDAVVLDNLSAPSGPQLTEESPEQYYLRLGLDGRPLTIPADLDEAICHYYNLTPETRAKFDRAAYWMDMASRQWNISISISYACLVSAVESLTDRGITHQLHCSECNCDCPHEVPGATERFRAFLEVHAAGAALRSRRSQMYKLRSGILHGSNLMELDLDGPHGWDPPEWKERNLHDELWGLTRVAVRHWLQESPEMANASV